MRIIYFFLQQALNTKYFFLSKKLIHGTLLFSLSEMTFRSTSLLDLCTRKYLTIKNSINFLHLPPSSTGNRGVAWWEGEGHVAPPLGDVGGGGHPWLLISLVFGVEWL